MEPRLRHRDETIVCLEGRVIPLAWGASDAILRVGILVFDTEEEIELSGQPLEFLEELVDSTARVFGRVHTGTRGVRVMVIERVEFVDDDDYDASRFEDDEQL